MFPWDWNIPSGRRFLVRRMQAEWKQKGHKDRDYRVCFSWGEIRYDDGLDLLSSGWLPAVYRGWSDKQEKRPWKGGIMGIVRNPCPYQDRGADIAARNGPSFPLNKSLQPGISLVVSRAPF